MIRDVNGAADRGERDYSDLFSSWQEFFPPEPWPLPLQVRPRCSAAIGAMCTRFAVNYERHLPLWWRVMRRTRGWVPQPIRMRIANRLGWRIRPRC